MMRSAAAVAAALLLATAARAADDFSYRIYSEREHEARQGMLFSFGLGGGSLRTSVPYYPARNGAIDLDFRLGYGFSDRFQLFGDLDVASAALRDGAGSTLSSWTLTLRGQTVLVGDRNGNGLNVNAGIGLGGLSQSSGYGYGTSDSPVGLALTTGLSYDARIARHFALSPELFYMWHEVPNGPGYASDRASTLGLRLNLLWYIY